MGKHVLVTGAGGFIGSHLVQHLRSRGYRVRGADLVPPRFAASEADEFLEVDLRSPAECRKALEGAAGVFHLAADMGGVGYISKTRAAVARNNSLININMLDAAVHCGVERLLFASSACVYPLHRQHTSSAAALRECEAVPAEPEPGYGWEKLYMEQLCQYYRSDYGLDTRVVRLHNVYGPRDTFEGGREKAPAAICRKAAQAPDGGEIEIWGDGRQTRSFMYVADCVEGLLRVFESGCREPLNIGRSELVTIDQLADLAIELSGKSLTKRYCSDQPQGVRGRNSDNTKIIQALGWEPQTSLKDGLKPTYRWIAEQVRRSGGLEEGFGIARRPAQPAQHST